MKNSGIGFLGLLTLMFIGFKITGFLYWSWWLVLLPLYIVPAIMLGFAITGVLITTFVLGFSYAAECRHRRN